MPKTLTTRNPRHPKNVFDTFRQNLKKALKSCPTQELLASCDRLNLTTRSSNRKDLVEALVLHGCQGYKEQWKQTHGWDIEDASDTYKWRDIQKKMIQEELKRREKESPPDTQPA